MSYAPRDRRSALRLGNEAYVDGLAVNEIGNISTQTGELIIENIYKQQPASNISNAHCSKFTQYFTGNNNPIRRFRKWKNENYYIVETNKYYTTMSILNIFLMISLISLAFYIWKYDCKVSIVPKNASVDTETVNKLNTYNTIIGSYVNVCLAALITTYNIYRIFKRTTNVCPSKIAVGN